MARGAGMAGGARTELLRATELYKDYSAFEEASKTYRRVLAVCQAAAETSDGNGEAREQQQRQVLSIEERAEVYNRLGLCAEKTGDWAEAI
eukprot:SAG22_NODE_17713_length_300_cov_0.343284_1_plen_90_part_10